MKPSQQQQDILDWVAGNTDNLIIEAVAGSGKSTTLEMIINAIPPNKKVLVLAFSKEIELALQAKNFPRNVDVRTFHALGFKLIRNTKSRVIVNAKKSENILKYQVLGFDKGRGWESKDDQRVFYEYKESLCTLLSHIKNRGILNEFDIRDNINELVETYQIDVPSSDDHECEEDEQFFLNTLIQMWAIGNESARVIDFDDMIYLPLLDDLMFPQWDVVLVDEAQDLNRAQRMFLRKLLGGSVHTKEEHNSPVLPWIAPQGRTIVVGDSAQAIYGFRGADMDSMFKFTSEFDCVELPLSTCYRCDKYIVEEAQSIVPEITAREGAEHGSCASMDRNTMLSEVRSGDAILCRLNAPLIDLALHFWHREQGILLTNTGLKDDILYNLDRVKKQHHLFTPEHLEQWIAGEELRLASRKRKWALAKFMQIADCLRVLCSWVNEYERAYVLLEQIFRRTVSENHITLTTIHKAKGLEWDRVFLVETEQRENEMAWQQKEEMNLRYVAITRARHQFFYVSAMPKPKVNLDGVTTGRFLTKPNCQTYKEKALEQITEKPAELPQVHREREIQKVEKQFTEGKLSLTERLRRQLGR